MSLAEALKVQSKARQVDPGSWLVDDSAIGGMKALLGFVLTSNVVGQLHLLLLEEHSDESGHVSDFEKLRSLLVEKYGEPDSDRSNWRNPLFRSEPSKFGLAVAAGHVARAVEWELEDTSVRLSISGDNYKVRVGVTYASRELRDAMREDRKREKLQDL